MFTPFVIYVCMYVCIGTELLICVYLHCVMTRVWAAAEEGMTIKQPPATSGEFTLWKWPWDKQPGRLDSLFARRERKREREGWTEREVLNLKKWKCFEVKNRIFFGHLSESKEVTIFSELSTVWHVNVIIERKVYSLHFISSYYTYLVQRSLFLAKEQFWRHIYIKLIVVYTIFIQILSSK